MSSTPLPSPQKAKKYQKVKMTTNANTHPPKKEKASEKVKKTKLEHFPQNLLIRYLNHQKGRWKTTEAWVTSVYVAPTPGKENICRKIFRGWVEILRGGL